MRNHLKCFGKNHSGDSEDEEDDDNVDGYCRLETAGGATRPQRQLLRREEIEEEEDGGYFRSPDSYQFNKSSAATEGSENSRQGVESDSYTEVDVKGKRLHKQLKRREVKRRFRHYLHSTWKWLKRGMAAVVPGLSATFMFPSANAFVTVAGRKQAAAEARWRERQQAEL